MNSTSESIENLAGALAKAQAQIEHADANAVGQAKGGKYKYAKLENVITAIKKPFADNGLSYVQLPVREANDCGVTTMLMHCSGEFIRNTFLMPAGQSMTPQGIGSLITYARRYSLTAICGIGQEDDDAKSANDVVAKDRKVDELLAERLKPAVNEAVVEAKKESMIFFASYNRVALRYATTILAMNDSAEDGNLAGLASARLDMDDDDFATLNKLKYEFGGSFSDKCKESMATKQFSALLIADTAQVSAPKAKGVAA